MKGLAQHRGAEARAAAHEDEHDDDQRVGQHDEELVGECRQAVRLHRDLQALRQGEEERAEHDAHRLPMAEVDQRDGDEAAAGDQRVRKHLCLADGEIRARKARHRSAEGQGLKAGARDADA